MLQKFFSDLVLIVLATVVKNTTSTPSSKTLHFNKITYPSLRNQKIKKVSDFFIPQFWNKNELKQE